MLHRALEHVAHLHPLELGIGAADLLGDGTVVLAVRGADRLIERHGHVRRPDLHGIRHVVWRNAEPLSELAHHRLSAELDLHLLVDADHRLMQLLQAPRKPDRGSFVPEVALDLARDGERRKGRELIAEVGVEALDRLDQAEVPDLDDVVERLSAVGELAREKVDEVVVAVDQLRANPVPLFRVGDLLVAAMERPQLVARHPRR